MAQLLVERLTSDGKVASVLNSPESLCCVLEQDTLSAA